MKPLKLLLILILIVSFVPFLLLASGDKKRGGAAEEEGVITLRIIWENWGADFTQYLDGEWTERYEQDHPNVKLEWLFPASWQEKEIAAEIALLARELNSSITVAYEGMEIEL